MSKKNLIRYRTSVTNSFGTRVVKIVQGNVLVSRKSFSLEVFTKRLEKRIGNTTGRIALGQEHGLEIFIKVHLIMKANGFLTTSCPFQGNCNTPQMGIFHQ